MDYTLNNLPPVLYLKNWRKNLYVGNVEGMEVIENIF